MLSKDALALALEKNLDLVKISPNGNPPICKIIDYGKFLFEKSKREKEQKKKQKIITVKEIYLSLKIDVHDFNTKVNHAIKFLKEANKVKVAVKFRGREMAHIDLGRQVLQKFREAVSEYGEAEKDAKFEGRNMAVILSPKK